MPPLNQEAMGGKDGLLIRSQEMIPINSLIGFLVWVALARLPMTEITELVSRLVN